MFLCIVVVVVSFTSTDITVNEVDGLVEVCVTLNHTVETTIIVSFGTLPGTAKCEFRH